MQQADVELDPRDRLVVSACGDPRSKSGEDEVEESLDDRNRFVDLRDIGEEVPYLPVSLVNVHDLVLEMGLDLLTGPLELLFLLWSKLLVCLVQIGLHI